MRVKKVVVAGTFEIVHPGHIFYLKKAAGMGRVVTVIVSRDKNAAKMKGRLPAVPERQRLAVIRSVKCVDSAVLGGRKDFLGTIRRLKPDVILLGPDQIHASRLRPLLAERGLGNIKVIQLPKRYERRGFICKTSEIIGKIRKSNKS